MRLEINLHKSQCTNFARIRNSILYKYLTFYIVQENLYTLQCTMYNLYKCSKILLTKRTYVVCTRTKHRIIDDRMEKYGSLFVFISK